MLPCRAFVVLSVWLFVLPSESISSDNAPAWDIPRFSAEGRTLYKAASSVTPKAGTDVVVQDEEVLKERAPFFGAGIVVRNYFGRMVPVQSSKLVLEAPSSLPLHYATQLLPDMKPQKTEANGHVRIVFEQGPMDALDEVEDYLPKEIPEQPQVAFSTGASWQAVAEGYGQIIEEKASQKDVQSLVN